MANNGTNDIQGEILHNVGLKPDEQTNMCNGNGSIEHKIIKDETSSYCSEESADSPLDFSFKRRNCETEASSTGSPNSPGSTQGGSVIYGEDKKFSDNEDGSSCNGNSNHNNYKREYDNRMSSSNQTFNPAIASVVQAIQSGAIPSVAAASMCGSFPAIAALMDPRIASQASNKSSRPFKAYPKEPLSVPFGCFGMNPYQTIESNMLQGLNLSSEDIMQLYKHQLRSLQGHHSESPRSLMKPSTIPSATATSPHTGTPSSYNPQHHSAPNTPTTSSFNRAPTPSIPSTSSGQTTTNSSSRRRARTFPDDQKDEAYWERRRKNNEAAKRSRDARRAKEDEIAIRAALLEQENLKLRVEVAALKTETAKLRCMLYNT
uniref:Protein giant-like n=1 Tax=Crassostrea virginica TaxID=6565 RepID=A0A8B8E3Y3_CRAVI|nr:protein giant-like [Crassostrea virginica]XP_022334420.1 protein giant-like [Crassostrea virginica]XP_022334421.1 protein giant-like [Crassostrea virginica]